MAIRIKARSGESAEQMMRRFKKLCEKEGLTKDVKRQSYYEKPSERRRRAMRKSLKRTQMPMMGGMGPAGGRMGGKMGGGKMGGRMGAKTGGRGPAGGRMGGRGGFGGPRPAR